MVKPELTDSGWAANLVAGYLMGASEWLGHLGYADTDRKRRAYALGVVYALARGIDLGLGRRLGDEQSWLLGAKLRW